MHSPKLVDDFTWNFQTNHQEDTVKIIVSIIVLSTFMLTASNLYAADPTRELSSCLTDSMSGKERKILVKWVFFSMAAHPEINNHANITSADQSDIDKSFGQLFTRLLAVDCPAQTLAALQNGGAQALTQSFKTLGEVAIMEIMTASEVTKTMVGFEKYVDTQKLNQLVK